VKLDKSIIDKLTEVPAQTLRDCYRDSIDKDASEYLAFVYWELLSKLKELDLIVKPGDSSQSTLVENK